MWVLLLFLLLLFIPLYEPMSSSPYDMVQEQAGTIEYLHKKISTITMSEASVNELQKENNQMTGQINQLQKNIPSKEPSKQYPT